MAKHDVTKSSFSQNTSRQIFFRKFDGRGQIDAEEGNESFAPISVAAFELSRKPAVRTEFLPPPPSGARVNILRLLSRITSRRARRRSKTLDETHIIHA